MIERSFKDIIAGRKGLFCTSNTLEEENLMQAKTL